MPGGGRRVCVIGAGIAGLVTAKVLREDGCDVTVFEKDADLGGVWSPSRTYPGLFFLPLVPERYRGVGEERRRLARG